MRTKFEALGTIGLIQDIPGYAITNEAMTDGENFCTDNDALCSALAYEQFADFDIGGGGNIPAHHIQGVKDVTGNLYYQVIFGTAAIAAYDGTNMNDIDNTSGLTASVNWSTTILNGNVIATNGVDAPLFWDVDPGNDFADLAGWNANTCRVIKAFKGYLFAFDVTKGGTRYPYRFKWSENAVSGIPLKWDETDPTTGAGEVDLGDNSTQLIDGRGLRDVFFLYAENQTIGVQFIGGDAVWRFYTAFRNYGILTKDCVVEFKNQHFVVMDGDVRVHDGHSSVSIIDQRNRKWMFDLIDTTNFENTFVSIHEERDEIWICFPTAGNTYPNKALVWNYNDDSWSRRDLPTNTTHLAPALEQTGTALIWTDATMTWQNAVFRWGQQLFNPTTDILLAANTSGIIYKMDTGLTNDGVVRESRIERTGISVGEDSEAAINCITNIYPRMEGDPVSFEIGSTFTPTEGYVWEGPYTFIPGVDYKIDCLVSGRYHAIRMYNNSKWRLSSLEFEYEPVGER